MSGGHGAAAHGAAHGGHGAGHEEHAGIDPMKLKMGILLGAVIFIVVFVSVFSMTEFPALASGGKSKAQEPVLLPPMIAGQVGNSCDTFVFDYILTGLRRCR